MGVAAWEQLAAGAGEAMHEGRGWVVTSLVVVLSVVQSLLRPVAGRYIPLVTFDGASNATSRAWLFKKDPVMGGTSNGTFTVQNGVGVLKGVVGDMPVIGWPSFIKAETQDLHKPFPDVSHCSAVSLELRSSTNYTGYHFAFGTTRPNAVILLQATSAPTCSSLPTASRLASRCPPAAAFLRSQFHSATS